MIARAPAAPHLRFLLLLGGGALLLWPEIRLLLALASDDSHSHVPVIPLVAAYLLWIDRGRLFGPPSRTDLRGLVPILAGAALAAWGRIAAGTLPPGTEGTVAGLSLLLACTGGFLVVHGGEALRRASFPFLFLLFMVPLPPFVLEPVVASLQRASAEVVAVLFRLTGTPVFRSGTYTFSLPGLAIEVASQCSGIRSSLSLFVVSVLAGHLFLRSFGRKALLSLSVFPITVFKNGVRIVTLSLLSIRVDPGFLTGRLHKLGGIPFFAVAFFLLLLVLAVLRRTERRLPDGAASLPDGHGGEGGMGEDGGATPSP